LKRETRGDVIAVNTYLSLFLHLLCFVLTFLIGGCSKSDNGSTQTDAGPWTISGKTYLVSSVDALAGVTVKCAGISSTSGSDGSYQLRGVPGGAQLLTAEKAGYEDYSSSIEVRSDMTYYVYIPFKTTNLSGFVTNRVDGPIFGAKVSMSDFVYYTDISGRYKFSNVPRGSGALSVTHPRYTGYDTVLSLTSYDEQFDVGLKRDSIINVIDYLCAYVDESQPNKIMPIVPFRLYLRGDGYDSAGVYHSGIRQIIYLNFSPPQILLYNEVSILEARIQLCADGPYTPLGFQTYSAASGWDYSNISFSRRPPTGPLLFSGKVGDRSSAKYWSVLDTDGFTQLITQWRLDGSIYGIIIQGTSADSVGFYSGFARDNQPKITLSVRF
jgi:hypothetical protein